jgi:hypothetical protein
MARNGYAQDFDLIDVPGYPGMRMVREAALQLAGACAEFWMETGDRPGILETFRTIQTQQHYANTMPAGTAATPGKSPHGNGLATDMASPMNSYSNALWAVWDRIAAKWGLNNVQGRNTKSPTNPRGEAWHYVYVGNPQIRATGREMADMANLAAQVDFIATSLGWARAQADVEDKQLDDVQQKQEWMGAQADEEDLQLDTVEGIVRYTQRTLGWARMQQNRIERKLDEVLAAQKVKSAEVKAPLASDDEAIAAEQV